MKQTLNINLSTQLKMTPQLQHAIKLLQMSTLDLQQEIQSNLDSNPLLEVDENDFQDGETQESNADLLEKGEQLIDLSSDPSQAGNVPETPSYEENQVTDKLEQPLSEELSIDATWEDTYQSSLTTSKDRNDNSSPQEFLTNNSIEETLQDHLIWQLNLVPLAEQDKLDALTIIDSIDPNGFLNQGLSELLEIVNLEEREEKTSLEILENILGIIQNFDPVGVGARDLSECLILQLNELELDAETRDHVTLLINKHLEEIASKNFLVMKKSVGLSENQIIEAVILIKSLNPRPGSVIASSQTDYVYPDAIVKKIANEWVVDLNSEVLPKVRINKLYEKFSANSVDKNEKAYLKENLQEAKWFLKSLQTRHDTLLKVASKIVEVQKSFIDFGPEHMKPLILADIAQATGLHESTISRITNRKYLATPRGVYELKYFFSSHVGTESGGEISSTAIRALIQKLISEENNQKPLSDSKLTSILLSKEIKIARRTVAKYREALSIPSSSERKKWG